MRNVPAPKIIPILATFSPNLAGKLMMRPSDKRAWKRYYVFRNYREKIGRPLVFFGDRAANAEIFILRKALRDLQDNPWAHMTKIFGVTISEIAREASPDA